MDPSWIPIYNIDKKVSSPHYLDAAMGGVDADQAEVAAVGQVPHRDEEDLDPAE